jgi:dihydrofolate synthase/folylpolyglutamate synthase
MTTEERYQKTLDYLYSYVDFSLTRSDRYTSEQFNLSRMYDLASRLDHPQAKYPVIHIAGTKGKGSVAAFCSSVLFECGYRVGLYTSPHLHDYAERIQINGALISHEELTTLVDELKPVFEAIPQITTFEITTALAFEYFARQGVDAAVIEVGLGGRLDATNIVLPNVAVITSLSYDHMQLLGDSLAQIAWEKAGIIKPGVPVVMAPQQAEAGKVIKKVCAERKAPLTQVGEDLRYQRISNSLNGQSVFIWTKGDQPKAEANFSQSQSSGWAPVRLDIHLLGEHQVHNAAAAYAALKVFSNTLPIQDSDLQAGFLNTRWPGRFEILRRDPPIIIDCAHNRDSAGKLKHALDEYFPGMPVVCLYGASEDKDISGMYAELMPRISQLVVTKSFHPRAIEPERLVEIASQYQRQATVVADIPAALEEAIRLANGDKLVLVTGSIFVAAAAREAWFARNNLSPSP